MSEGTKECRFTKMNAKDQNSSVYLSNILRDFEEECGNIYIKNWSLNMIYRRLFLAWIWNLDSHVHLRSI